ncbi:tryptophan synthase subunit alpha [Pasteurella canis]|uniref:tryptophan synthase subunit alpha n=1 Tax=Pasteurella canis TaxID=753 RepID=UPI001E5BF26A|nr:tryptophan synthase subunit alpha [Pasteurella canis]UEA17392.1 tryptophan synthase subunit alpha [Pasteurella canis]
MSRFNQLFHQLNMKNEGAFIPFVTLCDPNFDRSFDIICTLIESGADALKVGFPFSDPLLDAPIIQAANKRALEAGCSSKESFALLAKVRSKFPDIPIGLLLCANLVYAQGIECFYQRCAEAGVDAVLIVDVPLFAHQEFTPSAEKYSIQQVFICPPNADEKTIQQVAKYSQGYTYLISRTYVTSAENQDKAKSLDNLVERLKANHAPPILQGVDISQPEQVRETIQSGITGVISDSAIVKIIEQHLTQPEQGLIALAEFVKKMKKATAL